MWTRESIKNRAKAALTGRYGNAIVTLLIYAGISYAASMIVALIATPFLVSQVMDLVMSMVLYPPGRFTWDFILQFYARLLPFYLIMVAVSLIITLLIQNPLTVGMNSWYSRNRENRYAAPPVGEVFFAFREHRYGKIVGGMAYMTLIVFLWSLLFVIPGIIASYRYRFVPWILADNPSIGYRRAMDLSRQMTDGEKGNIFVFDLSFIGWFLLGVFTCYIGLLFVVPYYFASCAELYADFRHRALTNGLCSFAELGFAPPAPQAAYGAPYGTPYGPQY